ncbi:MAG TPA: hypothetical protein VFU97_09810 [Xanthobacteraceae bacterium]|nr:hypothetical protein [Xanthobacteraceae bacterium]
MVTNLTNDLRPAIRERLRAVEAELAELPQRQKKLEALRDSLKAMLAHEDALHGSDSVDEAMVPAFHPTNDRRSLADLILRVLGTGPKTLEELKEAGATWAPVRDSTFPGRAINFALVGLQKGGYVERLDNGAWKLVPEKSGKWQTKSAPATVRK